MFRPTNQKMIIFHSYDNEKETRVTRGRLLQMAFGADDFRNLQHLDGGDL